MLYLEIYTFIISTNIIFFFPFSDLSEIFEEENNFGTSMVTAPQQKNNLIFSKCPIMKKIENYSFDPAPLIIYYFLPPL